jgi:hypothetical protein
MATSATTSSTSSAPRTTVAIIATLGAVVLAVIAELIVNQFTLTDVAEHSIGHAVLAFAGILLLAAALKTWHATPTPYGRSARKVLLAGLIGGISGLAIESAAALFQDNDAGSVVHDLAVFVGLAGQLVAAVGLILTVLAWFANRHKNFGGTRLYVFIAIAVVVGFVLALFAVRGF